MQHLPAYDETAQQEQNGLARMQVHQITGYGPAEGLRRWLILPGGHPCPPPGHRPGGTPRTTRPALRRPARRQVLRWWRARQRGRSPCWRPTRIRHLAWSSPVPPDKDEKYSYLRRHMWVLTLCSVATFPPLIYSQMRNQQAGPGTDRDCRLPGRHQGRLFPGHRLQRRGHPRAGPHHRPGAAVRPALPAGSRAPQRERLGDLLHLGQAQPSPSA